MLELTDETKDKLTDIKGPMLIKFGAQWCSPCKSIQPTLDKIEQEFNNVSFVKVDIDNSPELAVEYSIRSIPALIFIRDGVEIKRQVGNATFNQLKEQMDIIVK